jgi:hypothetical protein
MQAVHYNNTCVTCIYEVILVLGRTLVILVEVAYGYCESLKSVSGHYLNRGFLPHLSTIPIYCC